MTIFRCPAWRVLPDHPRPRVYLPFCIACRTGKFAAWVSTPRPGSRVASVTLGHSNKAFGSARIARGIRALDLVRAGHHCGRSMAHSSDLTRPRNDGFCGGVEPRHILRAVAAGRALVVESRPSFADGHEIFWLFDARNSFFKPIACG